MRVHRIFVVLGMTAALVVGHLGFAPTANADHNTCPTGHTTAGFETGVVSSTNVNDYYRHQAQIFPSHTYTLTMTGGDADLYVYDSGLAGTGGCSTLACSSTNGGSSTDSCRVTGVGTYHVRVKYFSGGSVFYTLQVTTP
jgi:hypothetical protein